MPKVSIIVPIYNMAAYLHRCLDSLVTQQMEDVEIIAVNDGSTDDSGAILRQYAELDARLHVIDQANQGVSAARNTGIVAASGEYIGFVDPDDWIDAGMYQTMYESAVQHDADIVMCTYIREFADHAKVRKFALPQKVIYQGEDVRTNVLRRLIGPVSEELSHPQDLDIWGTVWSKMYRSNVLKDNHITFVDLHIIGSNEDSLFNIHACYYAQSFIFINQPFYHYWRANTASITSTYNPVLHDNFQQLYVRIEHFIRQKALPFPYLLALQNRICLNVLGIGLNILSNAEDSVMKKMSALHRYLRNAQLRRCLRQLRMAHFPIVWKVFYVCARFKITAGLYAMLIAIEWLRKRKGRSESIGANPGLASRYHHEPRRT